MIPLVCHQVLEQYCSAMPYASQPACQRKVLERIKMCNTILSFAQRTHSCLQTVFENVGYAVNFPQSKLILIFKTQGPGKH